MATTGIARPYVPYTERHGCEPPCTLNEQIAAARSEMGEARWRELEAEWSDADPVPLTLDQHIEHARKLRTNRRADHA